MNLEIYNSILKESGIDPMGFDKSKLRKYPNGERMFRHDIFKGKVIWKHDYFKDYLLFISCYHPLIGLFTSRKHHPYTKRKRVITLAMMLCVGSFFAGLSSYFDEQYSDIFHVWMAYKLVVSWANGIILFIMELMLRFCQQCPCRENIESNYCNNLCKCCTKSALSCWGFISFGLLIAMIILVSIHDLFSGFLTIFILQFVFSWILQCGGLFLKFRKLWKKDMEHMDKLPASDPYRNVWSSSRTTFSEYCTEITFKELLDEREKAKFPYFITFFDSNKWIQENPQYFRSKNKRKCWSLCERNSNKTMKEKIESDDDEDEDEVVEVENGKNAQANDGDHMTSNDHLVTIMDTNMIDLSDDSMHPL